MGALLFLTFVRNLGTPEVIWGCLKLAEFMRLFSTRAFAPTRKAILRLSVPVFVAFATLPALEVSAQSFSFSNVSVSGNSRIETDTILSYLGFARGESVYAAELNAAGQRLRQTGLFENVEIEPRGGTLAVIVTEFPTVYRINFEGNRTLDDGELFSILRSKERRIYNPSSVELDVADITQAYADKGRINAVVTPRIIRLPDNRVNVVFEVNENGVTEIESIGFTGNRSFSDRRLRGVLETKQAGILRTFIGRDSYFADRLEFDKQVLTDFYLSRGYVDFEVLGVDASLTQERDAYLLNINVEEGQQFRFGTLSVISELDEGDLAALQSVTKTRSGSIYSPLAIENDIARLEKEALRQGLQFVQVEPRITRNDRDLSLDVEFALVKGPRIFVERIDIEGNNTTLDRVVRQQFRIVEGDPFNPRSIRESAERIRALGFFSGADVQARNGSSDDQVVIDVNVTEAPTGSLSFGANFSSDTGFGLVGTFRQNNFLGRGQKLNLQFSTAESNRAFYLSFAEPYVLGRDLEFGFDVSYGTTNNEAALYDTEEFSLRPSLTFPVSERGRLQVFYGAKFTDITDVSTTQPDIVADAAQGGLWNQSLGYNYSWDSRRNRLNQKTDYVLRFGQEFGFGDTQYVSTTAFAGAETRVLGESVTLRATVEGGYLYYNKGDSRITDRFFLSGRQMRGFELYGMGPRYYDASDANNVINDPLGGNAYAVARLEAEFPIGLPEEYGITGGAFFDYGSVWDPGMDCSGAEYLYCDFTPRAIAGVSILWDTPIGPLRFNWSEALDVQGLDETKSFDVTISTSF